MNRSEKDQLTDEIIGEAVLSLLREKGPINMRVLIARLRSMETSESDPGRREAIAVSSPKSARRRFPDGVTARVSVKNGAAITSIRCLARVRRRTAVKNTDYISNFQLKRCQYMSQVMLNPIDLQADLPDTALSEYFRNAGDMLAQEAALLGAVVSNILATDGHLTHKAIILQLIGVLETTDDVVMADVVRKTLEIVVDHTVDDI